MLTVSQIDEALTEANRIAHDPRETVEDRKAARVLVDFYLDQRLTAYQRASA